MRVLVCVLAALALAGAGRAAAVDPGWGDPARPYDLDVTNLRPAVIPDKKTDPVRYATCRWVVIPPGPRGPGGRFWVC